MVPTHTEIRNEILAGLDRAVESNDANIVRTLLRRLGELRNTFGLAYYTTNCFRTAAKNNNVPGMRLLLDDEIVQRTAPIDINNRVYGKTILVEAVENDRLEVVGLLLERGADITIEDANAETALYHACKQNMQMVNLFMENRADLNVRTRHFQRTLLMAACEGGALDVVDFLLENEIGGSVNDIDVNGKPVAYFALMAPEILSKLIEHGIKANPSGFIAHHYEGYGYDSTLLIEAVKTGNADIVEMLIVNGADINKASKYNDRFGDGEFTPLMAAAVNNYTNIAALLITQGADPLQETRNGVTALDIAHIYSNKDLINLLKVNTEGRGVKRSRDTAAIKTVAKYLSIGQLPRQHPNQTSHRRTLSSRRGGKKKSIKRK